MLRLLACVALGVATPTVVRAQVFVPSAARPAPLGGAMATGRVAAVQGTSVLLQLRTGDTLTIDLRGAQAHHLAVTIYLGEFLQVQGELIGAGILSALSVSRAKAAPSAWSADIL